MEMNNHGQSNSIAPYSELGVLDLEVKLQRKETFREALQVLIAWLEDGQCNDSNSAQFYSLIQLCLNYMEKLKNKQEEFRGEAQTAEEILRNKSCSIQLELNEMLNVFKAVEKKNILDSFSDCQIQKIQEMRKDIEDLKENCAAGIISKEESSGMADANNEYVPSENVARKVQNKAGTTYGLNVAEQISDSSNSFQVHQNEMQIIASVSCYLYDVEKDDINSCGVNIDGIYSHLKEKCIPVTSAREIELVMRKYPSIFKESSEEKKWTCISINPETMKALVGKN